MEENKSKKSAGVPLVLIIAILIIAIACCILYISKLNNRIEQLEQKQENNQNQISNLHKPEENITKKEGRKVYGVGDGFKDISEVAKASLDFEVSNVDILEIDLDDDGIKENITYDCRRENDDYGIEILRVDNNEIKTRVDHQDEWGYVKEIYIVDLNKEDKTKEIITIYQGYNGYNLGRIYVYSNKELKLLDEKFFSSGVNILIDEIGRVIVDAIRTVDPVLTKEYYQYYNGNLITKKIDSKNILTQEFVSGELSWVSGESPNNLEQYYYTYNKNVHEACQEAMNQNYNLENVGIYFFINEGDKMQIIDFNFEYAESIIEAKLQNGKKIYIFPDVGFLAG